MNGSDRIPIVLCGSEDSELAVAAVADGLRYEGYPLEVLLGVDVESGLLTNAADRIQGRALFVLCQADRLDRSHVRRLEGLFSARKGPQHGMLTVDLHGRRSAIVVSQIIGAVALTGRRETTPHGDDGRHMRDVVVPSAVASVPGAVVHERRERARPDEPPVGFAMEPRGITGEALGLPEETTVFDPAEARARAAVPEPDVLISTDPMDTGELRAPPPGDGVPMAVAEDFPFVGDSGRDHELGAHTPPRPWDRSGPVELERVATSPRPDPRAEPDARPLRSASTPLDVGLLPASLADQFRDAPPSARFSGGRFVLLLVAAAGMVGIVVMASLHAAMPHGGEPPGVAQRGVPKARAEAAAKAPEAKATGPERGGPLAGKAGRGAVAPLPTIDPGSSSGPMEAAGAGSTAGDDREPASTGAVVGGDELGDDEGGDQAHGDEGPPSGVPDERAPGPGPAGPSAVPPLPESPLGTVSPDAAIAVAIAEHRLLELDDMLVAPSGTATMTWDDAAGRCRRRQAEGLRDWRLPSKAQLVQLRKAKLITSGSYWSRAVVGGDEVYSFDAASGRMNVWLKVEPNARALCVHKRPS